jgi:hypothetical protein
MTPGRERQVRDGGQVVEDQAMFGELSQAMTRLEQRMDRRFEQVDRRFGQIDRRFENVDVRLAALDQKLDRTFDRLDIRMTRQFHWVVGMFVTTIVAIAVAVITR